MTSAAGQNREIEQLRKLLFQTEAARLEALGADVVLLQQYIGNPDRLETATADILVAALERAEVNRPRELANVIAPSVVSAIRSEIRNSRDLMVDALYPITGRLVSAAVANAFKELVARLEQRLNALTSTELWIGRIKSLATGRPISEFVLANANPPRVNRLLMIERGNGRLVADWKREETSDERADLLSAMVAAILEFSVQALAGEGNLQQLDFGGREIVLRASPRFILAAECIGPLRPVDDARINSLFFDTIETMDRGLDCDTAMLTSLASSIEADPAAGRKSRRGAKVVLLVLAALVAAGLAWLGNVYLTRMMLERRTNDALQELVGKQPLLETFPLRLDFDHRNRSVLVSGIEPSQIATAPLVDALAKAAAPYQVVGRIGVVPGTEQSAVLRANIDALRQSVTGLQAGIDQNRQAIAELRQSLAGLQKSADETGEAVAGQRQALAGLQARIDQTRGPSEEELQSLAGLRTGIDETRAAIAEETKSRNQQYDAMRSIADSPAERLDRFMASTAIFFGTSDAFADDKEAEQQIGDLAGLLAGNDLRIRVVGHADDTGTESINRVVARKRADQVIRKLVSLGVEPARLFVVSRSSSMPISDVPSEGNRRVTFETVFRTERLQ
ncbi:OmpA family protein [Mesorhizobium australafricanum]|uniref:OmpA family protein n=1 Tax=Mesorhizobium australafricanum TaxID=3072311 RepID=A0ABU4X300_9HYPH|nr:OmpA family protein [Mesorhizobium sp. VK3E]MDX8442692.1 OmpA family protein [Mesorhizobium sp. VK3E]